MKLTNFETKVLNATRANEYEDAYQSEFTGPWTFSVIDNSGLEAARAKGVISSLIKKELIKVVECEGNDTCIVLTEEGKKIFDNADGKDCNWGGPKLLKIKDEEKVKKIVKKARFLKGEKNEENVFQFIIEANSMELLEQISEKMQEKAIENEIEIIFSKCVDEEEGWFSDTFPIKYEYGSFTNIRKILGEVWKETKQELGYK